MKKLIIFFALLVIIFTCAFIWWTSGTSAEDKSNKQPVIFVVKQGEGVREIANNLKHEGLIRDPIVFFLLAKKLGIDNQIEAGDFRISPSMTPEEIAKAMTHGTLDIWVTIPEGKRADEIADIFQKKIPNYKDDWRKALEDNEGYLFPDTYLIPKDAGIQTIISLMRNTFTRRYDGLAVPTSSKLSQHDIVTLASLVEREARFADDRPLVASVFLNRLNIGMALQVDATIQYALGYQPGEHTWWKKNLTADDIKLNSPYNTYQIPGLPPTPISNPGTDALQAVVTPAKTDYIYYVSDSTGHLHFAKTLQEHNANIKKYGL
ncbi:MAG TPA: endolytic transglycosylase MltG [Candidatus Saccharimonadales bacterium]|nr:endolytic transglycosylase MltG [Candidatus Saccharimonadales bacterium]